MPYPVVGYVPETSFTGQARIPIHIIDSPLYICAMFNSLVWFPFKQDGSQLINRGQYTHYKLVEGVPNGWMTIA